MYQRGIEIKFDGIKILATNLSYSPSSSCSWGVSVVTWGLSEAGFAVTGGIVKLSPDELTSAHTTGKI